MAVGLLAVSRQLQQQQQRVGPATHIAFTQFLYLRLNVTSFMAIVLQQLLVGIIQTTAQHAPLPCIHITHLESRLLNGVNTP